MTVVDINENGLTELTRDIRSSDIMGSSVEFKTYPMNYSDKVFKKMFIANKGFDIVANFSAHKHVRSEKDIYSVEALLRNNVINAKGLLDLLLEYTPKHFFCVSTDKAANPVNIMGGSKKIMEDMIMAYSDILPITTARFANVAFSNGSLPYGFIERYAKNQPISAPNDVTRYFVSPIESGHICLMACILGKSGSIFFPKLRKEQEMTFSAIAEEFIKEMGHDLDYCKSDKEALSKKIDKENKYPVHFSGSNTTGEKDYEEFYTEKEKVNMDRFSSLGIVDVSDIKTINEVNILLESFEKLFESDDTKKSEIVELMSDFLGNFDHKELGMNLDSKM